MAVCQQRGTRVITIKYDLSKAHRRTAALVKDRKYLVVRIPDADGRPAVWVNLVHTYGIASAQHYWGRTAALFLRLLYQLLGPDLQYGYVFVDDYSQLPQPTTDLAQAKRDIDEFGYCECTHEWEGVCSGLNCRARRHPQGPAQRGRVQCAGGPHPGAGERRRGARSGAVSKAPARTAHLSARSTPSPSRIS